LLNAYNFLADYNNVMDYIAPTTGLKALEPDLAGLCPALNILPLTGLIKTQKYHNMSAL